MATYKRILKNKPNKNGLYPIIFRIYKDDNTAELSTPFRIQKNQWDNNNTLLKSNYQDYRSINETLNQISTQLAIAINKLESEENFFTAKDIVDRVRKGFSNTKSKKITNFIEILTELKKNKKAGSANIIRDTINKLKQYRGDNIPASSINYEFIKGYSDFIASSHSSGGLGVRMRDLRARYNEAVKLELIDDQEPFKHYSIKSIKTKRQIAITKNDIDKFISFDYTNNTKYKLSYLTFLFSYYSAGINFTDVCKLKKGQIMDELVYKRSKTGKLMTIPLYQKNKEILKKIYSIPKENNDYIFPYLTNFHETDRQIADRIKKTRTKYNKDIKFIAENVGITANLTSYVARHSFATTLYQSGTPVSVIKELLGHENVAITEVYLKQFDTDSIKHLTEQYL
ncbi:site-specific integrase [Elizabethkingia anophelis]|uniref:Integrase n=1 Tax=Elizabethkingia anophelis NUHP1 TaxID=1338011 RepID=A0A077EJX0_9FLAO|nr:site-specific integrase [Elizabethkingia anophelis]AIL47797.1 Integrase [Elizabethkingia anophelis NUHP1]